MPKVLIIDDSLMIRMDLRKAFANTEFDIVEAADGEEALRVYAENLDTGFVLCDFNLPGMNGLDVMEKIFQESPTGWLPAGMLTTEKSRELKEKGKELGVLVWVVKPFHRDKLIEGIRLLLKKHGGRNAPHAK